MEDDYWDASGTLAYNFKFQPSEIERMKWTDIVRWLRQAERINKALKS